MGSVQNCMDGIEGIYLSNNLKTAFLTDQHGSIQSIDISDF